jgi:hypothetical protein
MIGEASDGHVSQLVPAYVNGTLDVIAAGRVRRHLAGCATCRADLLAWQAIATAACLDAVQTPAMSPEVLNRALARIERSDVIPSTTLPWPERMVRMLTFERKRLARPLIGVAAAAMVAGAIVFTPMGSYAQGFLTIFTPKQFAAVPVTTSELQSLPDLQDYGTVTEPAHPKPIHVDSAAAASTASGMTVLVPGTIPSGTQNAPRYEVIPGSSAAFTFSAAKAKAAAAAKGKALPAMPANIDGSSVQVTTGAAVVATYPATANSQAATAAKSAAAEASGKSGEGADVPGSLPALVLGQTPAPTIQATGASVSDLEQYLLAQPGISPQLAQAIKDIGDPTSTLPIPIPVNKAISHPVQVQGVTGLSVADASGIAGGIIWEKNGIVYGVGGAFSENELLAVANSLH